MKDSFSSEKFTKVLLMVAVLIFGCDQDQKNAEITGKQAKYVAAEPAGPGTGFNEMAKSVMEQAASQGLQMEASDTELLARLIRTYLVRGDLHQAFGNPEKFNLTALIQWAASSGVSVDYDKPKLEPYAKALATLASKTNAKKPVYARVE